MRKKTLRQFSWAIAIGLAAGLLGEVTIAPPRPSENKTWAFERAIALARSGSRSGGRSRGGSYKPSSPSRSQPKSAPKSKPAKTQPAAPQNDTTAPRTPETPTPRSGSTTSPAIGAPARSVTIYRTNTIYVPGYGRVAYTSPWEIFRLLVLLFLLALAIFLVISSFVKKQYARFAAATTEAAPERARDLRNDVVTVNKLQIALLAEARSIQTELTDIARNASLENPEGICEFLRETAIALLRIREAWSHVLVDSRIAKDRDLAAQTFEKFSIRERAKYGTETFSQTSEKTQEREFEPDADAEPAAYIVVTLLVGTEHDKPLLPEKIHTSEELEDAINKLAVVTPEYLLTYELLWTPQNEEDSLSYDDLLAEYPDMTQIA